MKKYLLIFSFLFVYGSSFTQEKEQYKNAIGIRGGWVGGLTGKHFLNDQNAIEAIISSGWGWRGYQITGLYEIHKEAFTKQDAENFFWYYGGGAHFGGGYSYRVRWHATGFYDGYYETAHYSTFGIDGIFGLEYRVDDIPVTLSLDVKPFFELPTVHGAPLHFWDSAFTIRYVFKNKS